MKIREDKIEDYINHTHRINLHPELECIPTDKSHRLLYGPSGVGKYTQMLRMIYPYSTSHLKYEKKIQVVSNNQTYWFKFSDIHYEIDIELLGCNDKAAWHDMFTQIQDIIRNKYPHSWGIIVCKNFHKISSELLSIFYSYMQPLEDIELVYYILTESISFIPSTLQNKFKVISVARPTPQQFEACFGCPMPSKILNLKDAINGIKHDCTTTLCQRVIDTIDKPYMDMREELYQLFIFDVPVETCVDYIINALLPQIRSEEWNKVFHLVLSFYERYHHHYRPLYHLEYFIYSMVKIIHGYSKSKKDTSSIFIEPEGNQETVLQTSPSETS